MNLRNGIKRLLPKFGTAIPFDARCSRLSAIASLDDAPGPPSDYLVDIGLKAAQRARSVSMVHVTSRMSEGPYYPEIWPGEHYKLLAGLIEELAPKIIIEIGTFTGLSSLAMLPSLPPGASLHTFDVVPWDSLKDSVLRPVDFEDGRFCQVLGDVADPAVMKKHAALFRSADILFVDGPKDGVFEHRFLDRLTEMDLPKKPLLVFDDIRLWNMLALWRQLSKPKLDMTSFGHWSGTGFVHWT